MRSIKGVFVALVAVLAVGAVASASALASPGWEVQEGGVWKSLGSGESRSVVYKSGNLVLTVPALGIKVSCKGAHGNGTIVGGLPGTGHSAKIELTGCEVNEPSGCKIKTKGLSAGNVAFENLSDELGALKGGGVGYTLTGAGAEEIIATTELGKKENSKHNFTEPCGSLEIKLPMDGAAVALVEGGDLNFTNPAQEGSRFKFVDQWESLLVAEIEQEVEGGGAIRAS